MPFAPTRGIASSVLAPSSERSGGFLTKQWRNRPTRAKKILQRGLPQLLKWEHEAVGLSPRVSFEL